MNCKTFPASPMAAKASILEVDAGQSDPLKLESSCKNVAHGEGYYGGKQVKWNFKNLDEAANAVCWANWQYMLCNLAQPLHISLAAFVDASVTWGYNQERMPNNRSILVKSTLRATCSGEKIMALAQTLVELPWRAAIRDWQSG
jgi:hypothetical protein